MNQEAYVIWSNSPDTSKAGIQRFCQNNAGRYGKSQEEMLAMPLSRLIPLLWDEAQSWRITAYAALNVPCEMPILVIADRAGEEPFSQPEMSCSVLSGEKLSEILDVRSGISTTFYSDGKDIRCRDITEHGADYYLFRELTSFRGLNEFTQKASQREAFTESDLAMFSKSLAPKIHQIYGWPQPDPRPLSTVISEAVSKAADQPLKRHIKEEIMR